MKKVLLFVGTTVLLASCSTEWSAKDEEVFKEACEKQGSLDCDCALKKAKEKYPNINDWVEKGGKDKELAKEVATNC